MTGQGSSQRRLNVLEDMTTTTVEIFFCRKFSPDKNGVKRLPAEGRNGSSPMHLLHGVVAAVPVPEDPALLQAVDLPELVA